MINLLIVISFFTDTLYWNHIKNTQRLSIIKENVTITGVVKKVYKESDGDLHIYVRTKNVLLNVEVICYDPIKNTICNGYTNNIKKPKIGDIIIVSGDYVNDKHHNWKEIHPVKSIKINQ